MYKFDEFEVQNFKMMANVCDFMLVHPSTCFFDDFICTMLASVRETNIFYESDAQDT